MVPSGPTQTTPGNFMSIGNLGSTQKSDLGHNQKSSATHSTENLGKSNPSLPKHGEKQDATNTRGENLFVLLSVNHGDNLRLAQLSVQGHTDDQFFSLLRAQYYRLRGFIRRYFSIWHYDHCRFMKFVKYDHEEIDTLEPSMPDPHDLQYRYCPKPVDHMPPISAREFRHRFYACPTDCCQRRRLIPSGLRTFHRCKRPCRRSLAALDRIPKKESSVEQSGDSREVFWGIQAVEEPSFAAICIYHILILLAPLTFWFLWLLYWGHRGDLQNASVPFLTVLTLLSLFWMPFRNGGSVRT